ncbi:MAG: MBL fold metallo-hydrolase [Nitrosomonadales bacterium]|nr:MBL fold metallo-hydrolase [Nitrosomonadales bacterium]
MNYGLSPADNEIELAVFGPGHGEAIAVHMGEGNWLLVDSCIDPNNGIPASANYLEQLGVAPNKVKAIVASHWHDDHVRGIAYLAEKYSEADFFLSATLRNDEAAAFVAAYSGRDAPNLTRGTCELYSVVDQRAHVYDALHRTIVHELHANQLYVRVIAWSPTSSAFAQSIANFAQYLPNKTGQVPIMHAPEPKENLEAVVIHINFGGEDAILLGSDLENRKIGWGELVSNVWCQNQKKASAYKVSHHGSQNGDHEKIWTTFLQTNRIACMTPFNKSGLPTSSDKERIKLRATRAYISSGASRKADMPRDQIKRLSDICSHIELADSGFGIVRLRKKIGEQNWNVELFGNAQAL